MFKISISHFIWQSHFVLEISFLLNFENIIENHIFENLKLSILNSHVFQNLNFPLSCHFEIMTFWHLLIYHDKKTFFNFLPLSTFCATFRKIFFRIFPAIFLLKKVWNKKSQKKRKLKRTEIRAWLVSISSNFEISKKKTSFVTGSGILCKN